MEPTRVKTSGFVALKNSVRLRGLQAQDSSTGRTETVRIGTARPEKIEGRRWEDHVGRGPAEDGVAGGFTCARAFELQIKKGSGLGWAWKKKKKKADARPPDLEN